MRKLFTFFALFWAFAGASVLWGTEIRLAAPRASVAQDETAVNEVFVVKMTEAGTLDGLLGAHKYDTDSIVVEGPMNAMDFQALWEASFYGYTGVINLEKAVIEEGRIPDRAFFNKEVQVKVQSDGKWVLSPVRLRHVILGEGIDEIGTRAFYAAVALERVTFTAPVRVIGVEAFATCWRFGRDYPVVFPEGLEVLSDCSFMDCGRFLSVTLPSTLKYLGASVLMNRGLKEIEIPESIEYMGEFCLAYNPELRRVVLPDKDIEFAGTGHFAHDYGMTELVVPSGMTAIPGAFCTGCAALAEFEIPESVESIGSWAFYCCPFTSVSLYEGVGDIGEGAFAMCDNLRHVTLPSTLESVGVNAFSDCSSLRTILCKAAVPPVCIFTSTCTPFGYKGEEISATLGVPAGSGSLYESADGWSLLRGIRELAPDQYEDFAGVERVSAAEGSVGIRTGRGEILIDGGAGEVYAVFGIDGHQVAQGRLGDGSTSVSVPAGLYLVKAAAACAKVAVGN
ncbi:MAG: leucine-rich repeat domain-containing protein [Muribaculaceae bacterium]|nr:leucine-rich repeat domain-containing protein [Muribaculaceae bacterium]